MNVIIIEDEKNAQEVLVNLLNLIDPNIFIKGIADNVKEGILLINKSNPDIIFLDIHLKKNTGFDLLEKLENFNGKIVFITAYDKYAVRAFKYSAFDYILKPINPNELKETLKKLKKDIDKEYRFNEMIEVLKHNTKDTENPKIILKTQTNQYILTIKEIIRCESEGAYTRFFTKNKKYLTSKNLKFYNNILEEYGFIRTHQSHLVNAALVKEINSDGTITMNDGTIIPISTRKKASVSRLLKKYID